MPFDSLYHGKTVLVTGHTGFKGSWLSTWLKMAGARVVGFSLPPEGGRPSLFRSAAVENGMTSIYGDIRDLSSMLSVFRTHEPEIVFHLAAQSLVRRSYTEPVATFETNVTGTVNVLESVRLTPSVRAAVIITSDKCYENREWLHAYRELDPMGGHDPYSSSKGCAELVVSAYRSSFFKGDDRVSVASARAGNVIGGGDWAEDRLVPDIVRALESGTPVALRNPGSVRPWQHVLEPLGGYLLLGERLWRHGDMFAEAWNFGPSGEDMMSVRELAERIIRIWGSGEITIQGSENDPHEARYLKLDCSKAHARLGWRPLLDIDKALDLTVRWYKGCAENEKLAGEILEAQIRQYRELLP